MAAEGNNDDKCMSRINMGLGALCVISALGIGVSVVASSSISNSYLLFPDVCDAVVENFEDTDLVPEINSLTLGTVDVASSQLRHLTNDDFFPPTFPVVLTLDPSRPPVYVGITAESVGKNGVKVGATKCGEVLPRAFLVNNPGVDDGPTEYIIAQLLSDDPICGITISQQDVLPGDGMGISEIVFGYACGPSGKVADVPRDVFRPVYIRDLITLSSVTGVVLTSFFGLAIYRWKRLKREVLPSDQIEVTTK